MKYDYLIVGSGFYGATCARLLAEKGYSIKILEKNKIVGGNSRTSKKEDIIIHESGPHTFHTNNQAVWNFVNKFDHFENIKLKVRVNYKNNIYSFPINLLTLYQVYGVNTPQQAMDAVNKDLIYNQNPKNFEEAAIGVVGKKIYEIFFKGYTTKQWNTDPKNLSHEIFSRIPIRFTHDDGYFTKHRCFYEGVPVSGYTDLVKNMLNHHLIDLNLNVDYLQNKTENNHLADKIIYTGAIDAYFDFKYGILPYRSLRFELERHDGDYQGTMIVNYTDQEVPFTRITEHKHFMSKKFNYTYITKEYPQNYDGKNEPLYPIKNDETENICNKYKKLVSLEKNVHFGGRLAEYKYYDMDQTIESAMSYCENIKTK